MFHKDYDLKYWVKWVKRQNTIRIVVSGCIINAWLWSPGKWESFVTQLPDINQTLRAERSVCRVKINSERHRKILIWKTSFNGTDYDE